MRFAITALATFALTACAQPTAPPASETEAAAPAPPAITGAFSAMSNTAMSITGDVDVQPDVLSFARGFRIEGGRIDTALEPHTDISAGGGTIADSSGNGGVETIELRRVQLVRVAADARDPQLCGAGETVTHAILAKSPEVLSLFVFSGPDAPGPNAHATQLCGIYNYMPADAQ
jgi:hypothetical protein